MKETEKGESADFSDFPMRRKRFVVVLLTAKLRKHSTAVFSSHAKVSLTPVGGAITPIFFFFFPYEGI